ncbi:tricorn protease domain 2-containing protein, partial [Athelia psychrophila]
AKTGKAIGSPLKGHSGPVRSVAYSLDGKRIATGSSDCTIWIWDAETGVAVRAPFKVHVGDVMSVAFSPDGTHIVSGSTDNTIRVWE